jgi:hypothetical protein
MQNIFVYRRAGNEIESILFAPPLDVDANIRISCASASLIALLIWVWGLSNPSDKVIMRRVIRRLRGTVRIFGGALISRIELSLRRAISSPYWKRSS